MFDLWSLWTSWSVWAVKREQNDVTNITHTLELVFCNTNFWHNVKRAIMKPWTRQIYREVNGLRGGEMSWLRAGRGGWGGGGGGGFRMYGYMRTADRRLKLPKSWAYLSLNNPPYCTQPSLFSATQGFKNMLQVLLFLAIESMKVTCCSIIDQIWLGKDKSYMCKSKRGYSHKSHA